MPAFVETTASIAAAPEKRLEILSTRPLTASYLVQYLASRGISIETASKYCVEVDFRIPPRTYQGVGFPNRSSVGFELRNTWFKGSSSPKDISLILRHPGKICILEGFMDFLSLLELDTPEIKLLTDDSDFLILNSLSFLKRSVSNPIPAEFSCLTTSCRGERQKLFSRQDKLNFTIAPPCSGPVRTPMNIFMSDENAWQVPPGPGHSIDSRITPAGQRAHNCPDSFEKKYSLTVRVTVCWGVTGIKSGSYQRRNRLTEPLRVFLICWSLVEFPSEKIAIAFTIGYFPRRGSGMGMLM